MDEGLTRCLCRRLWLVRPRHVRSSVPCVRRPFRDHAVQRLVAARRSQTAIRLPKTGAGGFEISVAYALLFAHGKFNTTRVRTS